MIRPADRTDAAAIAGIWNHYIRTTTVTFLPDEKTVEEVEKTIESDVCFVWQAKGEPVAGFARYFQFRGGRGYAPTCEHTVLLAEGARGRGAGRALIEAVAAHAKAAGKHTLWAGVSGENTEGINFHAACGFETVARLPEVGFKFDRWIDLVLMVRRLDD